MFDKQVVLVAGHDYRRSGVSFEALCINRMRQLIRKYHELRLKFTLFDITSGVIKSKESVHTAGRNSWIEIQRFKPVTNENYTGVTIFNRNQTGIMSITDIYKYIQDIGGKEPRSIIEFSVFSHGYGEGPILVNSYDTMPVNSPARDTNDKDGRAKKDFIPPNTTSTALDLFQKAFDPNAYIRIWGCAFTPAYHQVLHQLLKSNKYKQTRPSKLKDTDTFRFAFTSDQANDFFYIDTIFFPSRNTRGNYPLNFDKTFLRIKEFFKRGLEDTYSWRIAKASNVKCYGALPGTYADFEQGKVKVENPLMIVPTAKPPFADNFTKYIEFYVAYLGVAKDPEKRGYGTYAP